MCDIPAPYQRAEHKIVPLSPWNLECNRIDEAAELCNVNGFIETATSTVQLAEGTGVFLVPPSKRYRETGGCPYYRGELNGGFPSTVLCAVVPQQLHSYVGTKFCEGGRKIYCPIHHAQTEGRE